MVSALALMFIDTHPWMLPFSVLLSLQWPLTMLAGMRQFYIRSNFRTPPWADLLLLITCFCLYLLVWRADPDDVGARVATFSFLNIGCYLYAAWLVHSIR